MNTHGQTITVKRCHGLGNVLMLLPVLYKLNDSGYRVRCVTRQPWASVLKVLCPGITFTTRNYADAVDLDVSTADTMPRMHRADEYGEILGVAGPFPRHELQVPESWKRPFREFRGAMIMAPEAGHPARQWPLKYWRRLGRLARHASPVFVGTRRDTPMPDGVDLRGMLSLAELVGLISQANSVVCLDSGILHLAAALDKPVVAIFGGVDPRFRTRAQPSTIIVQAKLDCCPCNKNESCGGEYFCLHAITPEWLALQLEALLCRQKRMNRVANALDALTGTTAT